MNRPASPATALLAACLFCSGLCALIYQTTWLREFRLIFGASTAASAAVLAIFMGGVGWGSWVLGKRADRSASPLELYGRLELGIALASAVSPFLLSGARAAYLALGGVETLGAPGATCARLFLGFVVLGFPTFLMGGTLPAAVAAMQGTRPADRKSVAVSYALNSAGAVTGVLLATFWLVERLGNHTTLWAACGLNLIIALGALRLARSDRYLRLNPSDTERLPHAEVIGVDARGATAASGLYAAAAVSGFTFFLMELVWYRMLAPILGGSTFTFGIILAVALSGIALGSLGAAWRLAGRPPTMNALAWLCGLQAICLAAPFAIGDRLATWAMLLQPLGQFSFTMRVLQWSATAALVVLPASIVAGAQFPLLIGLLGRGRKSVGRHTGNAYAWNTLGAVAGSLAGGFGLLPLLTAPGTWRLVVIVTAVMGLTFVWLAWSSERRRSGCVGAIIAAGSSMALLLATGPTAAWRHNPVGAGRAKAYESSRNDHEHYVRQCRRALVWEAEGRESSVGLMGAHGYAFLVNGKSDGHARDDAGTQVMSGLLGALIHPEARNVCVIGLGTGSSAGWLAQVPTVRRVDVFELEPAIRQVAAYCAPVNKQALENPKLHLTYQDAREAMLTSRARYDLIFSEPSNPYRAGVASLFSREFYQATLQRLAPDGLFLQWIQAYEIDGASISSICATLASVFSSVEIWQTQDGDLLLMASPKPIIYDLTRLRQRIGEYPFNEALPLIWYVNDLEGVFSHFVAGAGLAQSTLAAGTPVITDDRNRLEYALARSVGRETGFNIALLREIARANGWQSPNCINGELDPAALVDRRATDNALNNGLPDNPGEGSAEAPACRVRAKQAMAGGNFVEAGEIWGRQPEPPRDPYEILLVALAQASRADDKALETMAQLRLWRPMDADALEVHYLWHSRRLGEATPKLEKLLLAWRQFAWADETMVRSTLKMIQRTEFPVNHRREALQLYHGLQQPFAVNMLENERIVTWLHLARELDAGSSTHYTEPVLASLEPHFPWEKDLLAIRARSYSQMQHPLAGKARAELAQFTGNEPSGFAYLPWPTTRVSARGRPEKKPTVLTRP